MNSKNKTTRNIERSEKHQTASSASRRAKAQNLNASQKALTDNHLVGNTERPSADSSEAPTATVLASPSAITWDSVERFDELRLKKMTPAELAAEISGRLPLIEAGLYHSLRAAIQTGHCLLAAKEQLKHGAFGKWCQLNFHQLSERTLQRYMVVARATELSDLTFGSSLTFIYEKLGMLAAKGAAKRKGEQPDLAEHNGVTLADLLTRLKSSREILAKVCASLPCDAYDTSALEELAAEIEALSAVLDEVKRGVAKVKEPKPAKVVEIPPMIPSGGGSQHRSITVPTH